MLHVTKASGFVEEFSEEKLVKYLSKIRIPPQDMETIVRFCRDKFTQQVSTREIVNSVAEQLSKLPNGKLYAARYLLKQDLRKMGPAGHAFEKYVGRLFQADGAKVKVAIEVRGECVPHEVDVLARWDHHIDVVECKFHNSEGTKSDVVVALYMYARYMDIAEAIKEPGYTSSVWIATNTKLTSQALDYAMCKNMQVLTVEQPEGNSIINRVVAKNLFPITSISTLDQYLNKLFDSDVILLADILGVDEAKAQRLGINPDILEKAKSEALEILG